MLDETDLTIDKPAQTIRMLFTRVVDGNVVKGSLQSAMQLDGEDDNFLYFVVGVSGVTVITCTDSSIGFVPDSR